MFLVARRVFLALAILVGLLVAAIAALPHLVSFDAVRARLVSAAESALHRKVEVGTIHLQIFSGFGAAAENVVVRNAPGWETPALLTAERVSVKLAFWPLLSRRIEIRRIVLEGATATIERDRAGALNIDDLAARADSESPRPPADVQPAIPVIRLSNVVITRGRLRLVDRKVVPGETVTTTFDAIEGRVAGISAISPSYVELSGRLLADSERNLAFKGRLGPPQPGRPLGEMPLDASLSAKSLVLARLRPYLGSKSGGAGVLTVETTAKGSFLGTLRLAGSVALAPRSGRDAQSRIPAIDGRFRGVLDWPHATLTLEPSRLSVARLPLTVHGRVDGLRTKPRLDLAVATQGDVPADRVTALPAVAAALPPGVRLSGRVRITALLHGPAGDVTVHGSAIAAPLGLSRNGESMPILAAPYATATLESREKGPRVGRLTIPSGALKRVRFENLHADWSWDPGKGTVLVAPEANIYGGRIAARLESELGKAEPLSRAKLELVGVRGEALVDSATTTRNAFAGAITGKLSLVSRGLSWDAIQRTATGEGHVTVAGPDLYTVHIKPEVGRMLATIGKYSAGFLTPPSLESTTFDRMDTSLRLAESRLATPDLILSGRDAAVDAAGSLGLDRTLSYRGHVVLQPALVRSLGKAGHYIADGDGRVVVPFEVTGTIADPKVSIDTSVIMDLGRRLAARLAGDRLGGWWKVLGDAVGSGALPMPGMGGGFPMPGGGGFPMPGAGGFPMPPSPGNLLRQFMRPNEPNTPQTPQPTPPATSF